ncbi:MAG: DUF5689 domain-containing protein [Flavobacteriaceae bacterium]|jgi:hypothetical protein|nr:DUF5689 domain-containing protein [Flavobacteriaceae bacterium]
MKTTKIFKFLFGLALLIGTLTSCVEDSEYDTPIINCQEPSLVATNTIAQVKAMYTTTMVKFDTDIIIEGYVVSSDKSGNIYKTISIQDKAENPTAAIRIAIDETDTYLKYNVGRKIFIKLKGLGISKNANVFEIGLPSGTTLARIPAPNVSSHIFRSCTTATIVPKVMTLATLNDDHLDMLIKLNDMQFRTGDFGLAYANLADTFSVNRYIVSYDADCNSLGEIIMRNSGFADFKNFALPTGKGSVVAVFSKYNADYQLFIRDTEDVKLTGVACLPLFEETFSVVTGTNPLQVAGWTNFAQTGTKFWRTAVPTAGNNVAEFNPFGGTTESSNIAWLITPQFDMDKQTEERLSFRAEKAFVVAGQPDLEVFYSSNWNGTTAGITTATWTKLTVAMPSAASVYTTVSADLKLITGKIHLAFKYTGSSTQSTRWRIDDIKIMAKK